MVKFYKKYWVIILLAFIATSLLIIKLVFIKEPTQAPPQTQQVEVYKGVIPGKTTAKDLSAIFGAPDPKESDFANNTLVYPRKEGGPPDEAIMDDNQTLALMKERSLSGNLNDYVNKYGTPEKEYFGEHATTGYKTYVWATKGLAVVAGSADGIIYEVWYFAPTTLEDFKLKFGQRLSEQLDVKGNY